MKKIKKNSIKERAKRIPKHIKAALQYELDKLDNKVTSSVIDAFIAGYKYAQEEIKLKTK